ERLEATYGRRLVEQGGLTVQTTLDLELQRKAERAVAEGVRNLSGIGATNGALVAIDPKTGELLAMVGSADFWNPAIQGQVNVAVSPRQPGSSFKPISYLAAFIKGYSPATTVWDTAATYPDGRNGPYVPVNADGKYRGPVRARDALAQSLNPPAVATLQYAGLDNVLDLAHRLGITDLRQRNRYGLSLTLGGGEVKLLDMTYVYSVLANNGEQVGSSVPDFRRVEGMRVLEPTVILSVKDPWGNEIEEHRTPRRLRITPEDHTYLITHILSDNNARAPMFGVNSPLSLGNRPAVKTGTTNDFRDFWTIGYTPQLVAGVWVGNTDGRPMRFSFSSVTAAPIWNAFMTSALQGKPIEPFKEPPGIVRVPVCLPSVDPWPQYWCPSVVEVFAASRAPKTIDERAALLSVRPPTRTPTPSPTRPAVTPSVTPPRGPTTGPIPTSTPR
ncbi:MAG: penicillin-binding transpeptidase domain-containing protein, partial [Dehalococcoidia bacterium]|nr:penicillin-binding transpeptidase domain-containing protein [Dehalococcoidia bacterium]